MLPSRTVRGGDAQGITSHNARRRYAESPNYRFSLVGFRIAFAVTP